MSHAGWKDVFNLVVALIGRESAPVQIFIYVGIAFLLLMVAEGLRANFFPWRPVAPRGERRKREAPMAMSPMSEAPRVEASVGGSRKEAGPAAAAPKFVPRPGAQAARWKWRSLGTRLLRLDRIRKKNFGRQDAKVAKKI